MSVPMPPTDNLYKFLAIGGVLLIMASQYIEWVMVREYWTKSIEFQPAAAILELEVDRLKGRTEDLKQAASSKDVKRREEAQRELVKVQELFDQQSSKLAELKAKSAMLDIMGRDVLRLLGWTTWGTRLGIALMIVGFLLWYFKVQRYLDRALKKQSESPTA